MGRLNFLIQYVQTRDYTKYIGAISKKDYYVPISDRKIIGVKDKGELEEVNRLFNSSI